MAATSSPNVADQSLEVDAGVLDRVVQQGGGDGDVVETEPGHDRGHRDGVVMYASPDWRTLLAVGSAATW